MSRFVDEGLVSGGGRRERLTRLALVWGVWTLVGLFFARQLYLYFARTEEPVAFLRSVVWQLLAAYVFAVSTPLVLWLARRFRFGRSNWRRRLCVHLLAGTLIAAVWAVCHITIDSLFTGEARLLAPDSLARNAFFMLDRELPASWIVVLATHA